MMDNEQLHLHWSVILFRDSFVANSLYGVNVQFIIIM